MIRHSGDKKVCFLNVIFAWNLENPETRSLISIELVFLPKKKLLFKTERFGRNLSQVNLPVEKDLTFITRICLTLAII
jgi:hypothetical protein